MALILRRLGLLWQLTFVLLGAPLPGSQAHAAPGAPVGATAGEARASAAFSEARRQSPLALHAFLFAMPKGADLHSHLSGAVYAESLIRAAGEDGLCVDTVTYAFVRKSSGGGTACAEGAVPAASAPKDQHLYDELIDSFSMRSFVPATGNSGHDHFFDSFGKFGGTSKAHIPQWLDEVASRAAAQNEQYLELMLTPDIGPAVQLAARIGYHEDFAEYRRALLEGGLRQEIPQIRSEMDAYERQQRQQERCETAEPAEACGVTVRYLFQVLRNNPPESVFAQLVLGFEVASADPRFVGLNLVQPEDAYFSMRDYALHMRMIAALRPFYPGVKVALHAGELAPGLVPPDGLRFHVSQAVDVAHAERIGHGVDVMYEDDPYTLLERMAARHVLVEINLTSNDVILNVKGDEHPLPAYLRYNVPVALSTDDEGVSRIDLTHEYVRAAETYPLGYLDLKRMARNSLEYSFLPGKSLWEDHDYARPAAECRDDLLGRKDAGACERFLNANEKARQQRELERRFHAFEGAAGGGRVVRTQVPARRRRLVH